MLTITDDYGEADRALARAVNVVQCQFLEIPGLRLTALQTAQLCALDSETCRAVLEQLMATRFLVKTSHAVFARAAEIDSGA